MDVQPGRNHADDANNFIQIAVENEWKYEKKT